MSLSIFFLSHAPYQEEIIYVGCCSSGRPPLLSEEMLSIGDRERVLASVERFQVAGERQK